MVFYLNIGFPRCDLASDAWWEYITLQGIDESRGSNDVRECVESSFERPGVFMAECVSASLLAHLIVWYLCVGTGVQKAHKAEPMSTPQPQELACELTKALPQAPALSLHSH